MHRCPLVQIWRDGEIKKTRRGKIGGRTCFLCSLFNQRGQSRSIYPTKSIQSTLTPLIDDGGSLIGAFVPANVVGNPSFVARDNFNPDGVGGKPAVDVGISPTALFIIGPGPVEYSAPGAGTLFLGVSDQRAGNNSGSFTVTILPVASNISASAQVDSNSSVGLNTTVGDETTVSKDVSIGNDSDLGDDVSVSKGVVAGSGLSVANNSNIDQMSDLYDHVTIGEDVSIDRNCEIGNDVIIGDGVTIGKECIIGDGAEIGTNAELGRNVTIEAGVCVADNSVVVSGTVLNSPSCP